MLSTVPGFVFTVSVYFTAFFSSMTHTFTLRLVADIWLQNARFDGALASVADSIWGCICWARILFDVSSDE